MGGVEGDRLKFTAGDCKGTEYSTFDGIDEEVEFDCKSDCIDSDGGYNTYEKGTAKDAYSSATDYCTDDEWLTEHNCWEDKVESKRHWCKSGCDSGACIQSCRIGPYTEGDWFWIDTVKSFFEDTRELSGNYMQVTITTPSEIIKLKMQPKTGTRITFGGCGEEHQYDLDQNPLDTSVYKAVHTGDTFYLADGDLFVNPKVAGEVGKCIDSDGGINLFEKGKVNDDISATRYDRCYDDTIIEYFCKGDVSSMPSAFNCDNDVCYTKETCQNGCDDGACIQSDLVSIGSGFYYRKSLVSVNPSNTITIQPKGLELYLSPLFPDCDFEIGRDLVCDGIIHKYWKVEELTSGNYRIVYRNKITLINQALFDLPAITEKLMNMNGKLTLHSGTGSCTDTDGGFNIFKKGTAKNSIGSYTDYCKEWNTVVEHHCIGENTVEWKSAECKVGCVDGACLDEDLECTDSDGGQDYYEPGVTIGLEAPGVWDRWADYCGTSGDEKGKLVEYICQSNNYGKKVLYECPNGCANGACKKTTDKGFRNAYWQCYDGQESYEGGPTSCKTSKTWQMYAEKSCKGHCYPDGSKCGVNSFSVSNECSHQDSCPPNDGESIYTGQGPYSEGDYIPIERRVYQLVDAYEKSGSRNIMRLKLTDLFCREYDVDLLPVVGEILKFTVKQTGEVIVIEADDDIHDTDVYMAGFNGVGILYAGGEVYTHVSLYTTEICGNINHITWDNEHPPTWDDLDPTQCDTIEKCTDTDGGLNYYKKGFMQTRPRDSGYWDVCYSKDELVEYYCENGVGKKKTFECKNGCKDGACIGQTICIPTADTKVYASQGPIAEGDYFIMDDKVLRYDDSNEIGNANIQVIVNDEKCREHKITLQAVSSNDEIVYTYIQTGEKILIEPDANPTDSEVYFGIFKGIGLLYADGNIYTHVAAQDEDICTTTRDNTYEYGEIDDPSEIDPTGCGSIIQRCRDSDIGLDYYTKGYVKWGLLTYEDVCYDDTIIEYYCKNNEIYKIPYTCLSGCGDGECLREFEDVEQPEIIEDDPSEDIDFAEIINDENNPFTKALIKELNSLDPAVKDRIVNGKDTGLAVRIATTISLRGKKEAQTTTKKGTTAIKTLIKPVDTDTDMFYEDMDDKLASLDPLFVSKIEAVASEGSIEEKKVLKEQVEAYVNADKDTIPRLADRLDKGVDTSGIMKMLSEGKEAEDIIESL